MKNLHSNSFALGLLKLPMLASLCVLVALGCLPTQVQAQVPTITSFSPLSAVTGASVTITGANFNTSLADNVVFMGATRAMVTAATDTELTVTVPTGATYAPITVLNIGTGLAAYSLANFTPVYSPAKSDLTLIDFALKSDLTSADPRSVVIGDLDGDGKPDLAIANSGSNTVSVFRSTGSSGTLSFATKVDFPTGKGPVSLTIGDIDGDGKPDLTTANYGYNDFFYESSVSVLRNTGSSGTISFAAKVDFTTDDGAISVAIGDIDGDGKNDLATANIGNGSTVSLLRNTSSSGTITFDAKVDFTTSSNPKAIAIGDIDGDGKLDLTTANFNTNTVSVFRNTSSSGTISFASKVDFASGSGPYSVAIGDIDGDGKSDLVVTNYLTNRVSVLRNNGDSGTISFAPKVDFITHASPIIASIGDITGDGKPDLAVANFGGHLVSVFRNIGIGDSISFAAKLDFATGNFPMSVAIGDLDSDGIPDLAIGNAGASTLSIIRQVIPTLPPAITSFTPLSAAPGTTVTIHGGNYNTTADSNVVFMGATRATVTTATATELTVTVPLGATYAPITVLNTGTGLATFSKTNFTPVYSPAKTNIIATDFEGKKDLSMESNPWSVAIGDIDGDGKADLVVVNYYLHSVSVLRNTSSGDSVSFAPKVDFATDLHPVYVAIGDINGDSKLDLAVVNHNANRVSIFHNTSSIGTINFEDANYYSTSNGPLSVVIGDIDGDGVLDLATANYYANNVTVWRNTGNIYTSSVVHFTTGTGPVSIAIGDVNQDGKLDLAVANSGENTVSVFQNTSVTGSISFAAKVDYETGSSPMSVAIGDVDGDGKPDMATANFYASTVSVLRNTSSGATINFGTKVDYATDNNPRSIAFGDINGDGKPDLVVAVQSTSKISVFGNNCSSGTISFAAKVDYSTGDYPYSVAIGDLDGNGLPDLAVANTSNLTKTVSILRQIVPVPPPTITSFSPLSAVPGATLTITGTNFNSIAENNVVFIGATRATVTVASVTNLTVTVPIGATYAPITVLNTNTNLAAYSSVNFKPIYSPAKDNITASDFASKVDYITGQNPYSVSIKDIDGDGKPELVAANFSASSVSVYQNTSSSDSTSFAAKLDFTTNLGSQIALIEDINGDGKPDLAVLDYLYNTISVLRNTSSSGIVSFATKANFATSSGITSIAIGDLNGDGKPDLTCAKSGSLLILQNTSSSNAISFAPIVDLMTDITPYAVAIGDIDGDGIPDIVMTQLNESSVSVLRNTTSNGAISFATKVNFVTGAGPISVSIGDVDGDGMPDLAIANNYSSTISVLKNMSSNDAISFATKVDYVAGNSPRSITFGDINGDGNLDLATVNYTSNTVSVFQNTSSIGTVSYADKVDYATGAEPISMAIGDINGDSTPDLVVANSSSNTMSVLRQVTPCVAPVAYTVSGGGDYCSGSTGMTIDLNGSESGVTYQLKNGGINAGSPVSGSGNTISFNNITTAGTYTVVATRTFGGCTAAMSGNVSVTVFPATTYYQDSDGDTYGNAATSQATCSQPEGYVTNNTDCNDGNAAIKPNASETCNTVDDNCNGTADEGVTPTYYFDADNDNFYAAGATSIQVCTEPTNYAPAANSGDCNDNDAAIKPTATEVCNSIDDNCNGTTDEGVTTTYYVDADNDNFYPAGAATVQACTEPANYAPASNSGDCNDHNEAISPTATEVCNTIDDNCNGTTDEGVTTTYYVDADNDNFYTVGAATMQACSEPANYAPAINSGDCNDNNAAIRPGVNELCNNLDDNCNGLIDEGNIACPTPVWPTTFVTGITSTAATLQWNPIACGYIRLQYRRYYQSPITWLFANAPAMATSRNISSLMSATVYEARIRTVCNPAYLSQLTVAKRFTTTGGSLNNPFTPEAEAVETSRMTTLQLAPNPTNGFTTLQVNSNGNATATMSVLDLSGRNIMTWRAKSQQDNFNETFDISDLPTGIYAIRVLFEDGTSVTRSLIRH